MHRVTRGENAINASPTRRRFSVGFGSKASIQIHASATPTNIVPHTAASHNNTPSNSMDTNEPDATPASGRRMSMHEQLLLRILSTPSDQQLFQRNSDDASPSQRTADDSFDSCLSRSNTPILDILNDSPDAIRCNTPPVAEGGVANRHLHMLYRDLNSPSATARLRALRALKSPTKRNAYGNFDVSYAEQDIITAEERMVPEKRDIRDVLCNVCVYVEVRSGTDNRSDGIKEHVSSLGAKVNERFLKDTTHVIFKDGLLSTYQKAKKMSIPVVSVLWIEACKRHMCLMNPDDFKISNFERYENPELFKRIRRQKSMQPGAEETVGNKKRIAVTGKTKAQPVVSPPSKLPVLHRIRKDDRLERILSDFENDNQICNANPGPVDEYDEMLRAAPMRMLERFRSTPTALDSPAANKRLVDDEMYSTPNETANADKEADTVTPARLDPKQLFGATTASRSRRRTILFTPQMRNVEEEEFAVNQTSCEVNTPIQPSARVRRRTIFRKDTSDKGSRTTLDNSAQTKCNDVVTFENTGSDSTVPTSTIRTRRSSMASGKDKLVASNPPEHEKSDSLTTAPRTNRRKTITAGKENTSPSVLDSSTAVGDKKRPCANTQSRRITVSFGNNTPTETSSMPVLTTETKALSIVKRVTIHSPKEMEVSESFCAPSVDESMNDLTKINSKGSEMNISTPSDGVIENSASSESILQTKNTRTNIRRTLFNPSAMMEECRTPSDEQRNISRSSVVSMSSASVASGRRKTLCTPGNYTYMEPLEVSETPSVTSHVQSHNDGSSICNRPDPTTSSTPISTVAMVGNARGKTLLQEYEETLMFSSTRAPERRRRTIFDISMDIMDHRLSEINRQAAAKKNSGEDSPVIVRKRPTDLLSPPPGGQQQSLDEFYRKVISSSEKSSKSTEQPTSGGSTEDPVVAPRRRKLFNIQSVEDQPSPKTAPIAPNPKPKSISGKSAAKRRSLAPTGAIPEEQPIAAAAAATTTATKTSKRRRTTTLFESPREPKRGDEINQTEEPKKRQHFPVGRGLPTMASQYNHGFKQQQTQQERQYLATTNLHTEQIAFVKEAAEKLEGFIIESDVTDDTTHLVTLESRRTINLLRALARGLWIVRYDWIVQSFRAGQWLPEEQFEIRDFSSAVQINRSERQAFGSLYRSELFADYGHFWISPYCAVPARQLRELLLLCRGKVTGTKEKAKYLVLDNDDEERQYHSAPTVLDGQVCVAPLWILDSITVNKVKKLSCKYRVR